MPDIILVKSQMGENIGAAARAMANFGITHLKLVAPRDGWPSESATANAVGAFDGIVSVEVFETVKDAVAPYHSVYATTARTRDMRKKVFTPTDAVSKIIQQQNTDQKTAILFGGERAGLDNDDIAMAQNIITFPTNPDFSSLNLAQSVLLLSFEYHRQNNKTDEPFVPTGKSEIATQEELNEFLNRLECELDKKRFFRNEDMRPTMLRNIRSMILRSDLTDQEVKTFQGILSALIGNKVS